MLLSPWYKLPAQMRNDAVKPYYDMLAKKKIQLLAKRIFDFFIAGLLMVTLFPLFLIISVLIKLDSKGSIFFVQTRLTANCKRFKIFKFRTMHELNNATESLLTSYNDSRVTRVGAFLRKYHLDEMPQLINIIRGDMSFVGTRPEVEKYINCYSSEMFATLLLPAGVTSDCSIEYKDEEKLFNSSENIEETYIKKLLPKKMNLNLRELKNFNLFNQFMVCIRTVVSVFI